METRIVTLIVAAASALAPATDRSRWDPRGAAHIPIGIANSVDSLKTFVEAEGNFSPGFATYGIYVWVWDGEAKRLFAPTMEGVVCEHGLAEGGLLIPWSAWRAGDIEVRTEVCQVEELTAGGPIQLAGARAILRNRGADPKEASVYVAIRPLGAAGGPIERLAIARGMEAILVNGHTALVADRAASAGGAIETDTIGEIAARGLVPASLGAESEAGDASGALRWDVTIPAGGEERLGFVSPVRAGRRAIGHRWDGVSAWAQFDLNPPDPPEGGVLQPDVSPEYLRDRRECRPDALFERAAAYWREIAGKVKLRLPDARWADAFAAIVCHGAMCMNEGAPDVAVVNYNVFNRDGIYMANIFHKTGNIGLAEAAIEYFLGHPFNGRVEPEADNPGQILWAMGEEWRFARDRSWLTRVYAAVRKIAAMIRYYRTAPEPHWVWDTSLDVGDALPEGRRKRLRPGACDGHNPAYAEAFDIAGLRAAAALAEAMGEEVDAASWRDLADRLMAKYDETFGDDLAKGYGSYAVLWPCRLYPFGEGTAHEQFGRIGAQAPSGWRYFPLARAHQGLLAGNREAAWKTLDAHLGHPQMRGWYAFDEGGASGVGGWHFARTNWPIARTADGKPKSAVAMPHGWAIAELHLLLRDALAFEDGERLVLLAGVPPAWFTDPKGLRIEALPTHFGILSFDYRPVEGGAEVTLSIERSPREGVVLRLPAELVPDEELRTAAGGDVKIPAGTTRLRFRIGGASRS